MQTEMNACGCIFTYFHQLRKPHFLSGNVRDGMTIYWQASGRMDICGWELTQRVQLFVLSIFVTRLISQFFVSDHLMLVNDSNRQLQEQVCWRASHFANHFNIFLQLFGSLKGSDNFMPGGLFFESLDSAIELHSNLDSSILTTSIGMFIPDHIEFFSSLVPPQTTDMLQTRGAGYLWWRWRNTLWCSTLNACMEPKKNRNCRTLEVRCWGRCRMGSYWTYVKF